MISPEGEKCGEWYKIYAYSAMPRSRWGKTWMRDMEERG